MKKFLPLLFAALLGAVPALAQTPPPPVNHDFDFWLGNWAVTTPDGKPAGTNRIESIAGGYALLENWTGDPAAGGGTGKSLNAFNPAKKQWQQFWVGSGSGVLELAGGLDAQGRMVLSGERTTHSGRVIDRITWTPNADESVRQLWDESSDGGKTWQVVFDGHYVKRKAQEVSGSGTGLRAPFYMIW